MKGILFLDKSQTCHFHAYEELFKYMKETYSEYIIILNDPYYKFSDQNLLPVNITKNLFESFFLYNKFAPNNIFVLKDQPNDYLWETELNEIIFDGEALIDSSELEIVFLNKNYYDKFNSVSCSKQLKELDVEIPEFGFNKIKDTESFFLGLQWADKKTYPAVIPTVDVALILMIDQKPNLVLGVKKDDPYHHLIGGFVDPTDDSYEDAAIRELSEEVNCYADKSQLQYITSQKINDWRYKNLKHNIITHLYVLKYNHNDSAIIARHLKACDDLVDLFIQPINEINIDDVVPHHRILVTNIINSTNK